MPLAESQLTPQSSWDPSLLQYNDDQDMDRAAAAVQYFSDDSDSLGPDTPAGASTVSDDAVSEIGQPPGLQLGAPMFVSQLFEGSLCCPGTLHIVNNAARDMGARMRWFTEWCDRANELSQFFRHRCATWCPEVDWF